MRSAFGLLFLSFLCGALTAQHIAVYDSFGRIVAYFENDKLIVSETEEPFVTVKGNIIFHGASDKQRDILLLVRAENIFARKKEGAILNGNQSQILFTIYDGRFTYRDKSVYDSNWLMARYENDTDTSLTLYRDSSDVVICRLNTTDLTTGKLVAIFYFFAKGLQWENQMEEKQIQINETADPMDVSGTSGTIRRLWNTGLDEFEWDGEVFKRKWNSFDYEEWTFDGTVLKRLWYPGDEEFVWDGKVLRRKWYTSQDEFEWDGTILRRRWGLASDEYIIQGNLIKPYFNSGSNNEWTIDGQVPIPLIILVVFGLLRK